MFLEIIQKIIRNLTHTRAGQYKTGGKKQQDAVPQKWPKNAPGKRDLHLVEIPHIEKELDTDQKNPCRPRYWQPMKLELFPISDGDG